MKRLTALMLMITYGILAIMPVKAEENTVDSLELVSKSAVLMEPKTNTVILDKNADERLSPASITKIMTLVIIFDELSKGNIKLEDQVTTSAYAKSMGGSQVFLEEGEVQSVETMIKCIVVASGNDASVAMAEHIAGSEAAFVSMMNERAKGLGMENTNFEDCCGLSESDNHYTSAKDVAIMSSELITKYPEIVNYSTIWMETIIHKTDKGEKEFVLSNTNKLLKSNSLVKGLKTGSTSKAKYCVSIVGEKDNVELVAVVMAAPDYKVRFAEAEKLINYGFARCKFYVDEKEYDVKIPVRNGKVDEITAINKEKFSYVDTKGSSLDNIEIKTKVESKVKAPVKIGAVLGKCEYYFAGEKIGESMLTAEESVAKTNFGFEYLKMLKMVMKIEN